MFPHHFVAPREKAGRDDSKGRAQHRLGGGAPTVSLASSPRSPHKAAALSAYRTLLGGGRNMASWHQLPQVQPAAALPATSYYSLDGLRKMAELHKGKHSTVHSYLDTFSDRVVAVKTYYKRTMAKRHFRNVQREVAISRLLARQRFTGTVQLLGAFEDESHIHLVQERCAGGDLYRRLVRAGGVLAEAEVCRDVVVPLLLTLTFLHANHIVHRDIKPENIMFAADGALRLGDFGLSIDAARERPTSRVGTLDYMAPEVVGMPSPDDIQRLGLAPTSIDHYGYGVDVWAVGILCYELLCGRPPFEVEDVKLTEQHIKFSEVDFPPHISPLCCSFIQQALTKRPERRPSAAQLFQHPWVQHHYQQLLAAQAQPVAAAAVTAAATLAFAPEVRRTVSHPASPSKSMSGGVAGGSGEQAVLTPRGVAAALAPFLPLSQAKMAHKVRLLSPGRPPSSSSVARPRRRVSDPLARIMLQPAAAAAAAGEAGAQPAVPGAAPATPLPAAASTCASDGAGSVALAADMQDDEGSGGMAPQCFETPVTPGLKTTPLPRQRPVMQQRAPVGRMPFLLPLMTPSSSNDDSITLPAELQLLAAGKARVARSRFAATAENDESQVAAALRASAETSLSSPVLAGRASSFTSLLSKDGSTSNLQLGERASSFTAFGGNSGGNSGSLPLPPRASSFTAFGGHSSGNLSNCVSPSPNKQQQQQQQQSPPEDMGMAPDAQLQRLQL